MTQEQLTQELKNTIGYAECKNKESFLTGAAVAFSRVEAFYANKIMWLESQVKQYKNEASESIQDLETLAEIINRYSK